MTNNEKELLDKQMIEAQKQAIEDYNSRPPNQDANDIDKLESAQWMTRTVLKPENRRSTTNLSDDDIISLGDLELANQFFDDDDIQVFIEHYEERCRSRTDESRNFLSLMVDMVGRTLPTKEQGVLSRFIGRRG